VLFGSALAVSSYWLGPLKICRVTAGGSNFISTTACNPWSPTDLIPIFAAALMLLLPDLTELNIFNLFTLKREIKAQRVEIDATKSRQESLEIRVSAQLSSISASQNLEQHNHVTYYSTHLATELPKKISEKLAELRSFDAEERDAARPENDESVGASSRSTPSILDSVLQSSSHEEDPTVDNALLTVRLLKIWESLSERLGLNRRVLPLPTVPKLSLEYRRGRFIELFKDELDTVRRVRNSVAHGKEVTTDDLRGAVRAAEELLRIADEEVHF
jgi:hypothetical protein